MSSVYAIDVTMDKALADARAVARKLHSVYRHAHSVDVDDFEQAAMLGAWNAIERRKKVSHKTAAKNAVIDMLRSTQGRRGTARYEAVGKHVDAGAVQLADVCSDDDGTDEQAENSLEMLRKLAAVALDLCSGMTHGDVMRKHKVGDAVIDAALDSSGPLCKPNHRGRSLFDAIHMLAERRSGLSIGEVAKRHRMRNNHAFKILHLRTKALAELFPRGVPE